MINGMTVLDVAVAAAVGTTLAEVGVEMILEMAIENSGVVETTK